MDFRTPLQEKSLTVDALMHMYYKLLDYKQCTPPNVYTCCSNTGEWFLKTIALIEAIDNNDIHTFCTDVNSHTIHEVMNITKTSNTQGLVICRTANHWEVRNGMFENFEIQPMPGAAEVLKIATNHTLFICTAYNNLIIFTNRVLDVETLTKIKLLQYTMQNISDSELMNFAKELCSQDKGDVREAFNNLLKSDYFKEIKNKKLIEVFNSRRSDRIRDIKQRIEENNSSILRFENKIAELATRIHDDSETLLMLESTEEDNHDELIRYLSKHPYIKEVKPANRSTLYLVYVAPIEYYDYDVYERIKNVYTDTDKEAALKAIVSNKYKLYTACTITFNTNTFEVGTTGRLDDDNNIIGHPHIDEYSCFGNHRTEIERTARKIDYIGAIEQISQAVLNINFYDGTVINSLMHKLVTRFYNAKTWLNTETNEFVSLNEIIRQEENNETITIE